MTTSLGKRQAATHLVATSADVNAAGRPFLDWVGTDAGPLLRKYGKTPEPLGVSPDKNIAWYDQEMRNSKAIFPVLVMAHWKANNELDPFLSLFGTEIVAAAISNVTQSTFVVDRDVPYGSVPGTAARVITATEKTESVELVYHAQATGYDEYAVSLTSAGRDELNRRIANLYADFNAAVKMHMCYNVLSFAKSILLAPQYVNHGMGRPRTAAECVLVMRNWFNVFGRPDLSSEAFIARVSNGFETQPRSRTAGTLVVPLCSIGPLMQGRRERYLYSHEGSMATRNLEDDSGQDTSRKARALGLDVVSLPLVSLVAESDKTSAAFRNKFRTGSIFPFPRFFALQPPEVYRSVQDHVAGWSWEKNALTEYFFHNVAGNEIRFVPGTPGPNGSVAYDQHGQGLIDYKLMYETYGWDASLNSNKGAWSSNAFKSIFDQIDTEPPEGPDRKGLMDPLMAWTDNKQGGAWNDPYPITVIGELPEAQNPDDDFMFAYQVLALRLREATGKADGSIPAYDNAFIDSFKGVIGRFTVFHPLSKASVTADLEIAAFNKKGVTYAPVKDFIDDAKNKTKSIEEYARELIELKMKFNTPGQNADFIRRFDHAATLADPFERYAATIILTQPVCAQYLALCGEIGVPTPLSGFIARFSEESNMVTPVLLNSSKVGTCYMSPLEKATYNNPEHKQGMSEIGANIGGALTDDATSFPLFATMGAALRTANGGACTGFMAHHRQPGQSIGEWASEYLNKPDKQGHHTNLFFLQGSKYGYEFPEVIDITGRHLWRNYAPFMLDSEDYKPRKEQMYPGAAFNNHVLDASKCFKAPPVERDHGVRSNSAPVAAFSYNTLRRTRENNTLAVLSCFRAVNMRGKPELFAGNHLRGPRNGDVVGIDQGISGHA